MYNYAIEALMVNELADITLVDNDQIVPVKVS